MLKKTSQLLDFDSFNSLKMPDNGHRDFVSARTKTKQVKKSVQKTDFDKGAGEYDTRASHLNTKLSLKSKR